VTDFGGWQGPSAGAHGWMVAKGGIRVFYLVGVPRRSHPLRVCPTTVFGMDLCRIITLFHFFSSERLYHDGGAFNAVELILNAMEFPGSLARSDLCGVRKSDILISRRNFDLSKKGKVASTAAGLVDIVDVTAKNEQSLLYALGPETGRIFMELKSNPSVSVNLHYTDDDDFKTPAQAMKDSRKRPRTLHPSTVHQRREAESEPANLDEL